MGLHFDSHCILEPMSVTELDLTSFCRLFTLTSFWHPFDVRCDVRWCQIDVSMTSTCCSELTCFDMRDADVIGCTFDVCTYQLMSDLMLITSDVLLMSHEGLHAGGCKYDMLVVKRISIDTESCHLTTEDIKRASLKSCSSHVIGAPRRPASCNVQHAGIRCHDHHCISAHGLQTPKSPPHILVVIEEALLGGVCL